MESDYNRYITDRLDFNQGYSFDLQPILQTLWEKKGY